MYSFIFLFRIGFWSLSNTISVLYQSGIGISSNPGTKSLMWELLAYTCLGRTREQRSGSSNLKISAWNMTVGGSQELWWKPLWIPCLQLPQRIMASLSLQPYKSHVSASYWLILTRSGSPWLLLLNKRIEKWCQVNCPIYEDEHYCKEYIGFFNVMNYIIGFSNSKPCLK